MSHNLRTARQVCTLIRLINQTVVSLMLGSTGQPPEELSRLIGT